MNSKRNADAAARGADELLALELVSALADGQLAALDCGAAITAALADDAGRTAWDQYHLIGDVLRSADLAAPIEFVGGRAPLVGAVMRRVAAEPAFPAAQVPRRRVRQFGLAAANGAWGWKLISGCASLAAVVAIGWSLTSGHSPDAVQASVPAAVVPDQEAVMVRDPRLDELLAAHRQFGGTSALQGPAGFLRNATFEAPGR